MARHSLAATEYAVQMRAAKRRLGLTLKQISDLAGVSNGTAVKVMQGDSGVLLRHVQAVARALGLSAEVVVTARDGVAVAAEAPVFGGRIIVA